jgi:hypothetical protein
VPAREILLHLACVLSGFGVALAGTLLCFSGHAVHTICGVILFTLGAVGVGLQGRHAVLGRRTAPGEGVRPQPRHPAHVEA